jgi:hypothetical protein
LCLENGIFEKYGVDVRYSTIKEGTGKFFSFIANLPEIGAMLKKLHDGEADIAITVTDGFIAGRAAGSNVSLIGTYVESPLTWAVCAAPDSKLNSIEDFMKKGDPSLGFSRTSLCQKTNRSGFLAGRVAPIRCPSISIIFTSSNMSNTSPPEPLQPLR